MTTAPYSRLIYWNGSTYQSVSTLITRISSDATTLYGDRNAENSNNPLGRVAIYFAGSPAIDLAPAVQDVLDLHRSTCPGYVAWYERTPDSFKAYEKQLKTWRADLRRSLRLALEPIVPFPLEEALEE